MQSQNPSPTVLLRSGLEEMEPDLWVLTIFDLIGCYSTGRSEEEAVRRAEPRVREYFDWLAVKDGNPAPFEDAVQVSVVERYLLRRSTRDLTRHIHAFFEDDLRPLREWDGDMALRLLDWTRQDLLRTTGKLLPDSLKQIENNSNWLTIDRLLDHIVDNENWCLGRLGQAVDRSQMPGDATGRLQKIGAQLREILPAWADADIVTDDEGEQWSPRKVIRRILWHERDHIWRLEEIIGEQP